VLLHYFDVLAQPPASHGQSVVFQLISFLNVGTTANARRLDQGQKEIGGAAVQSSGRIRPASRARKAHKEHKRETASAGDLAIG
jgi:hypothetical protein